MVREFSCYDAISKYLFKNVFQILITVEIDFAEFKSIISANAYAEKGF
jgi:hypothetical protein